MESERIKMSVVRTKYVGAELQYDGLEEVKVRVDKKCRCDCRVKEEVQCTKHIHCITYSTFSTFEVLIWMAILSLSAKYVVHIY